MRFESLEHYGLDWKRLVFTGLGFALLSTLVLQVAASRVLGQASVSIEFVLGAVVFYIIVSMPKRIMESEAFSESREAPSLAVLASTNFEATRSRARTMLMLNANNPKIQMALTRIKRGILLGEGAEQAVARRATGVSSYSVRNLLIKSATISSGSIEESGEESIGIRDSRQSAEESNLPLFTTICFFTPILLLLYAAFSHIYDALSLGELVALQLVILDVGFYFTRAGRGSFR